jgi:hypothetical protein
LLDALVSIVAAVCRRGRALAVAALVVDAPPVAARSGRPARSRLAVDVETYGLQTQHETLNQGGKWL